MKLWEEALSGQIYLGGETFVQRVQAHAPLPETKEVPRAQRRPSIQALPWYFERDERNAAIARAYLEGGYTQSNLAEYLGLSVLRVSRLIKAEEAKGKT